MSEGRKFLALAVAVVAGALLIGVLFGPAGPGQAAPLAVPTPLAETAGGGDYLNVVFWSADALTADGGSNALQLPGYEVLDLQYIIDQGTTNTTTLKIQFSNDNTNWSDGINIVANNAADANGMVQVNNFGRYTRLYADVTNTNAWTITARAVAK
jgi:hypothetical protein